MDTEETAKIMGPMFDAICMDGATALSQLNLGPHPEILDVGTGSGNFAIFLALQGFDVLTGEPSLDESRYARQKWEPSAERMAVRHRIQFKHFDASALPFDEYRFDAVFLFGVLHHVEEGERRSVLREVLRVCRTNGAVVVFEPRQETLEKIWLNDPDHPPAADPSNYTDALDIQEYQIEGALMDIFVYRTAV